MAALTFVLIHHEAPKPLLERAVHSICSQTRKDWRLVMVDDGSIPGLGRTCGSDLLYYREFGDVLIHGENKGLGPSMDDGVRLVSSPWYVILSADDWIEPEFAEKTMEAGNRDLETRAVAVNVDRILTKDVLLHNPYPYCALIERSLWRLLGGYRNDTTPHQGFEDWGFWIRCWEKKVPHAFVSEQLFHHEDRPDSMTAKIFAENRWVEMHRRLLQAHGHDLSELDIR